MSHFIPFLSPTIALIAGTLASSLQASVPAMQGQDPAPQGLGFWNAEQWIPLEADGASIGLRFESGLDQNQIRTLLSQLPSLAAGQADQALIHVGHTVYLNTAAGTSATDAWKLCEQALDLPGVMSASPKLWAPHQDPYYLTEEILVRWQSGTSAAQREAWTADLQRTASLDYTFNPGDVYRVAAGADALAISNQLAESGLVEFAIPDFQLLRVTYAGTNDPIYGDQWHLESIGQNGAGVDQDIDVEGAWEITRGTSTVITAVVDTGVELQHPDLIDNLVQGIDVLGNDNDPKAEDGRWLIFNW